MAGRRSALIVANDEYQDASLGRLRAPTRDAEALARVLGDPAIGGFEVEVISNQPEWRLRRAIGTFFTDRSREDLLLLHFSCHGVKDDSGQLYFATADTELANLDATAVPADFVNRHMTRSHSRRIVLLLDCCYSGAFARGMLARAGTGVELRERFEGRGRIVLTASSAMEYAFEAAELARDDGRPSVFTRALVRGLETGEADGDGDGRVSVDELYDYVYEQVRGQTPKQTPGRWNFEVAGELLIARSPALRPVHLPTELQQAVQHPIARVRLGAVEELEQLLSGNHAGLALAARTTLERLAADDSQRVSSKVRTVLAARPVEERAAPPASPPTAAPEPVPAARPAPEPVPRARPAPTGRPTRAETPKRVPTRPPPEPAGPAVAESGPRVGSPEPRPRPTSGARPRSRRPRRLLLAASVVVVIGLVLAMIALRSDGTQVVVGRPFSATSPWRLQVEGGHCSVTLAAVGDGQPERRALGSNYVLQMRRTGEFVVTALDSGCTAAVLAGAGDRATLPITMGGEADGAGGDSLPFASTGTFTVAVSGASCQATVHDATDGSEVAELDETDGPAVPRAGEFYVSSDWQCITTISSGDHQGGWG
jgi:caspase domain-containing protein